jgi:alkanesulfonate monooxygenase SsuD/methylene tetrahydromethanopterin reductase-like flavin-dependent oxidoreductase (luciferase family)
MEAIALYRANFRPSRQLDRPYVMLGFNVFAADTLAQAQLLASSMQQAFVNLRSGRPAPLPAPVDGYIERIGPQERVLLQQVLTCSAIGPPEIVRDALRSFVERTGADELIIASMIYDHSARVHSYEIAAQVMTDMQAPA